MFSASKYDQLLMWAMSFRPPGISLMLRSSYTAMLSNKKIKI